MAAAVPAREPGVLAASQHTGLLQLRQGLHRRTATAKASLTNASSGQHAALLSLGSMRKAKFLQDRRCIVAWAASKCIGRDLGRHFIFALASRYICAGRAPDASHLSSITRITTVSQIDTTLDGSLLCTPPYASALLMHSYFFLVLLDCVIVYMSAALMNATMM